MLATRCWKHSARKFLTSATRDELTRSVARKNVSMGFALTNALLKYQIDRGQPPNC